MSTAVLTTVAAPAGIAVTRSAHAFAAPVAAAAAPAGGLAGLGQVLLALCAVLAAIFLCAYLLRRMRSLGGAAAGALRVIADIRLGPKERAVLLQVGATQLLLGVAPGQISALHVLAEALPPPGAAAAPADSTSFRALLRRSLGK